jgi:hypothetical protein
LASDTHDLQLTTGNVNEAEVHNFIYDYTQS